MTARLLSRMTFFAWFLVTTGSLFTWYNPSGISLFHLWTQFPDTTIATKVAASLPVTLVLGLILYGCFRTMNVLGLVVLVGLVSILMWLLYAAVSVNILSVWFWTWFSQPILGFILTMGWQWPKIWRQMTGVVSTVETGDATGSDLSHDR